MKISEIGVVQTPAMTTNQAFFQPDALDDLPFGNQKTRRLHPNQTVKNRLQRRDFCGFDAPAT